MKALLIAITFAGLMLAGPSSAPAEAQRAPLAALDWLQQVKLEVAPSDSGAVITLFARDPASLQAIRDYVEELSAAASPTAQDPVCRMQVNRSQAKEDGLTATYRERTYFFCNGACRSSFLKQPARFAAQ